MRLNAPLKHINIFPCSSAMPWHCTAAYPNHWLWQKNPSHCHCRLSIVYFFCRHGSHFKFFSCCCSLFLFPECIYFRAPRIFFPNFIVIISWSILMLVIASQVVGIKQIYNLDKITSAVGVVIASYVAQFFIIGFLVVILIKLAY